MASQPRTLLLDEEGNVALRELSARFGVPQGVLIDALADEFERKYSLGDFALTVDVPTVELHEAQQKMVRMSDGTHAKLKALAKRCGLSQGATIKTLVLEAKRRGVEVLVSEAFLLPDDRIELVRKALWWTLDFLRETNPDDSRLRKAREYLEKAEG